MRPALWTAIPTSARLTAVASDANGVYLAGHAATSHPVSGPKGPVIESGVCVLIDVESESVSPDAVLDGGECGTRYGIGA